MNALEPKLMSTNTTMQINLLFKSRSLVWVLFFASALCFFVEAAENGAQTIGWGGGGAFTSTTVFNETTYLSSDVAGVWRQIEGHWQPFVEGLGNYNVTALVNFNKWLFAISSDELFVTSGTSPWRSTNITLNTNRSFTDQVYTISHDGMLFCIANRDQKIDCIDTHNHLISFPTPEKDINGVYFDKTTSHLLYFFSGSKLFTLDLLTREIKLLKKFEVKIVSLARLNNKMMIATSKNVFAMRDLEQSVYHSFFGNIINFFIANNAGTDVAFISIGNRWNTKLKQFELVNGELKQHQRVKVRFDLDLPHRTNQKSLTKLLSINQIAGKTWVTDYWGVYQLDFSNQTELIEVTHDAINTVATDLIVTDRNIYISAMDNGIIKISRLESAELRQSLDPKAISFGMLKGHAWSMLHHDNTLYGIISPWDDANDYLFSYSEKDEYADVSRLTNYKRREADGTFWGKAYSRQLAYYKGIVSFRDGSNGGLIKQKTSFFMNNKPVTLRKLNRVYKSIAVHQGLLYIASCEEPPLMVAKDQAEETVLSVNLPEGFCPFSVYSYLDSLYLLGSKSGYSVIYHIKDNHMSLLYESKLGSAFYQMAINPKNNKQIVAGTISWSNKSTSGLFVSDDGGETFVDSSCLLSHKNGVASIKIDNEIAYILLKVGGGISISLKSLFSKGVCKEAFEDLIR